MPTAHVEAELYHPGGDASQIYYELWVNDVFYTSGWLGTGYTQSVGLDVGENSRVRLEAAAVSPEGAYNWAEPSVLDVGQGPTVPPPNPSPASPPTVSNLSVRYWF